MKNASLNVLLKQAEERVLERQALIGRRIVHLGEQLQRHLASPRALIIAGGAGFLAGEASKRSFRHKKDHPVNDEEVIDEQPSKPGLWLAACTFIAKQALLRMS